MWVHQACECGDQESETALRLLWWWSHVPHSCRQALHRAMVTQRATLREWMRPVGRHRQRTIWACIRFKLVSLEVSITHQCSVDKSCSGRKMWSLSCSQPPASGMLWEVPPTPSSPPHTHTQGGKTLVCLSHFLKPVAHSADHATDHRNIQGILEARQRPNTSHDTQWLHKNGVACLEPANGRGCRDLSVTVHGLISCVHNFMGAPLLPSPFDCGSLMHTIPPHPK